MMFGWQSVRHMKRGLPPAELRRLHDFYEDYGQWQGFLVEKKPGEDDPAHPADGLGDWDMERIQGDLVDGKMPDR